MVQSFIVFWFHRRYGATTEAMGLVLFAVGLLQARSSLAAGCLGPRLGLLRTMVFTHLPSNVLLALVRFALSQMNVPARQAFIGATVEPGERTAAAAYTNTPHATSVARRARSLAPRLMQWTVLAAPFLAAAGVKVAYDVIIYAAFRRVAVK